MKGYVLIIDDDADVREMLCEVIADEGYAVAAVGDGQAVLDYLHTHASPFLIVLDLMMPVMGGREFRTRQRATATLATIPVVVLSADRLVDDVKDTPWLKKPVDLDRLLGVVRGHDPSRLD